MGVIEADDLVMLDEVEAITLDFLLSPPPTLMAETRSPRAAKVATTNFTIPAHVKGNFSPGRLAVGILADPARFKH